MRGQHGSAVSVGIGLGFRLGLVFCLMWHLALMASVCHIPEGQSKCFGSGLIQQTCSLKDYMKMKMVQNGPYAQNINLVCILPANMLGHVNISWLYSFSSGHIPLIPHMVSWTSRGLSEALSYRQLRHLQTLSPQFLDIWQHYVDTSTCRCRWVIICNRLKGATVCVWLTFSS